MPFSAAAPMMQLLSQSLSVLRSSGTHAPNTLASALTLPGMASRGGPHSPAESDAVSRRSVRSEALTHLSSNIMGGGGGASGVTVRAKVRICCWFAYGGGLVRLEVCGACGTAQLGVVLGVPSCSQDRDRQALYASQRLPSEPGVIQTASCMW